MKRSTTTHAAAALTLVAALLLSACGGGGGSSPSPQPSATATPTPTPTTNPLAFTCPSSGTPGTGSIARTSGEALTRHMDRAPQNIAATTSETTRLAVNYARATLASNLPQVAAREQALGATLVHSFDYASLNMTQRIVSVPTASLARAESLLRAQAGVLSVSATGERRYKLTSSPYWTTDPFFDGFTALQNSSAGNPAVNTYEQLPYAEASAAPGQWDMHAIGLEHAFGYVNGGTGVGPTANALGSNTIKIAIIDTGVDASHPELTSKIHHEACFITSAIAPYPLSTGNFSTDYLGHGTDVAGIAAEAGNNNLGFAGAGGKAIIYAYRVFPTPDDNCAVEGSTDPQCSSDTSDIASAINDAVAQGVNIISMSLGGGGCNSGVDTDNTEGPAVVSALNHGVIVVAAAGNAGGNVLDAPACIYTGSASVIAVGATGLDDGVTTGTTAYTRTVTGASPTNILEYVATYSQSGSTNALHSATSWGIVAPGGDPSNSEIAGTPDDLHWIENIWTSTPYQSSPSDTAFTGNCNGDYPLETGTADCRTLIAGTSMATPHVAGAAALILAVNPSYGTPAAMKALLCQTADNLGDSRQGCGRLNVYRAMATALSDSPLP
jgi:subtilisin family serine protease